MPRPWSRKPLSYRDALTLLGADDSTAMALLNRLTGVGVTALDTATGGMLSLFQVRDDLISWGNGVASSLRERITGLSRLDRTERIVAAHAVVVVTSFYEALQESELPDLASARLTRHEQIALTTDTPTQNSYRLLLSRLVEAELPMPSPYRPFELTTKELKDYYLAAMRFLLRFLQGLTEFENRRVFDDEAAQEAIVDRAVARYETAFRRLATDVPEFAMWASMTDAQATRAALGLLGNDLRGRVDNLNTGLVGLRELLSATSGCGMPDQWRQELSRSYRAHLDKPILDSREAPDGVVLPKLGKAYVNPACRIAAEPQMAQLAAETWWADAPVVPDIQAFLVGHLTGKQATRTPLVILGQPGSGKSVLTKILAAGLPEADFLPIRVELRAVTADADIQDQIQQAVYAAIDRRIEWPDLVAAAQGALPVVMLDGFDELLQATGVNQADYLERARNFQDRQAELGRPVAIVVTSRTAVADRARFPANSIAVRLEPFDETRVRRWLEVWAETNADVLAARDLRPLPPEAALGQGELAREPLLLLMLALYDAGANALQREGSSLGHAELYERLMTDFARREVRKNAPKLPDDEERRAIERELRLLSIAALAMFNRGRQIVTEAELDSDLAALAGGSLPPARSGDVGMNRSLTAAQAVVGRFFFVHEPTAHRDTGSVNRSFEFLHATFGEFLVARLVVHEVLQLVKDRDYLARRPSASQLDAGFLYAAASFELLSGRAPIIEFCAGLFAAQDAAQRAACRSLLIELLRDALYPHQQWQYTEYQPVQTPAPRRYAAFSANLVLLAVFAGEGAIRGSELISAEPAADWYSFAWLWCSQLSEWETLVSTLRVRWKFNMISGEGSESYTRWRFQGDLLLSPEDGSRMALIESVPVSVKAPEIKNGSDPEVIFKDYSADAHTQAGLTLRRAAFLGEPLFNWSLEGIIPYWRHVTEGYTFVVRADGTIGTALRLLLELALAPTHAITSQLRAEMYRTVLQGGKNGERKAVLRLLRNDICGLAPDDAVSILQNAPQYTNPLPDEFFDAVAEFVRYFGFEAAESADLVTAATDEEQMRAAFARAKVLYPPELEQTPHEP